MSHSVHEMVQSDIDCEGVLEWFHGLTELDRVAFAELAAANEPLTVDELGERVDRERSTAYRAVKRLQDAGFVEREQRTCGGGGYYHVFLPTDPDDVAEDMHRMLNDWYARMGQLIGEFREKYGDRAPAEA